MQLQLFVLCLRIRKHLLRVGKVAALKIYRYRYRGKSLFTYRLLTELKIPLPYISGAPVVPCRLILVFTYSLHTDVY